SASNMVCVKVPLLSEGHIKQLVVTQTSGTSVAFVVELLMSSLPYPVGQQSAATSAIGTLALYRIVPQQTGTPGSTVDLTPDYDVGYPFRNVDGDFTN